MIATVGNGNNLLMLWCTALEKICCLMYVYTIEKERFANLLNNLIHNMNFRVGNTFQKLQFHGCISIEAMELCMISQPVKSLTKHNSTIIYEVFN